MTDLNLFIPEKRKTASRRNDKVAVQLREIFSIAISKGDFPSLPSHREASKLPCLITITYVDISPDLRNATVYFSPLVDQMVEETLKFFELQIHYFKDLIAKKMRMRFIPNIRFKLDESVAYSQKIEELLRNAE
ncbi:MAG: ribosome-binding factor A [Holosporales bacterium]|jgi:ribosome-binding factor A|nr:ribosome-binding factor A [Holosporales bacterium]